MTLDLSTTRLDLGTGNDPADVLLKTRGAEEVLPREEGLC